MNYYLGEEYGNQSHYNGVEYQTAVQFGYSERKYRVQDLEICTWRLQGESKNNVISDL